MKRRLVFISGSAWISWLDKGHDTKTKEETEDDLGTVVEIKFYPS